MQDDYEDEAALDADIAKLLGQDGTGAPSAAPAPADTAAQPDGETQTPAPGPDADAMAIETDTGTTQADTPNQDDANDQRLKNAQTRMHQATTEAADLRKANMALQGQQAAMQSQMAQLQAQLAQLQAPPAQPEDDGLDTLVDDFPEIALPLVKKNRALEAKLADLQKSLESVQKTTDTVARTEADRDAQRHFDAIKQAHPDLEQLANDPGLAEWKASQPPIMQYALDQGSTADVILALNLYKESIGQPVPKQDKLPAARQAATPSMPRNTDKPTEPKKSFTRDEIAKMSMDEFIKHEKAIDEALGKYAIT